MHTRCLIIGSGPAGYTAAIYASRAGLKPILVDGPQPGGQLTQTTEIENFPGYPEGIMGPQMMDDIRSQAARFGTEFISGIVGKVDFNVRPLQVNVNGTTDITADTVIIATGASARYLGLHDEQRYMGMGVSACATCDGFFYRNRVVAVVGGGDTACEEAIYLAGLASKVYMIVRKDHLRASKVMQRRVADNPKIEVLYNTNTEGLFGEEVLEGARLVEHVGTDKERHFEISIDGFFLAIGHHPNVGPFEPFVELDAEGYIKTDGRTTATNIPGVFAAGDVADPLYKQAISAAGAGCHAALDAERYLMLHEL